MKSWKRTKWRRWLGVVASTAGMLICASQAAAEPFSLEFDQSLSYEGHGVYGWPGFNGADDTIPPEPPILVRLDGEIEDGQIKAEAEDFVVEPGHATIVPFESYFDSDWKTIGAVSGSFNDATGHLSLNLNLVQTIGYEGVICSVGPVPVTLSSSSSGDVGTGVPFASGIDGPGALVGSWESVPEPTGSDCDLRRLQCDPRHSLLKGPGAFGLSRTNVGLERVAPRIQDWTVDKFGIIGYEDEGGCLGKRPDPGPGPDPEPRLKIELSRLSVARSTARYAVKITNMGGSTSDSELCAYATHGLRVSKAGCRPLGLLTNGRRVQKRLKVTFPKGKKARAKALRKGRIKVRYVIAGIPGVSIERKISSAR